MIKLAAGWTLAIVLALAGVSSAGGQGPDVQIVQLECTSDPELVVIENRGDTDQPLAGWQLQSDPPDSEVYDLSVRGDLVAGASIRVQSGPSASGVFLQDNWGLEFIFRDDDPTDYARIVDDTGAVVYQVDCGGEVAPEPSPTLSPEPSPTPSPEPPPPNGVPNGGGPASAPRQRAASSNDGPCRGLRGRRGRSDQRSLVAASPLLAGSGHHGHPCTPASGGSSTRSAQGIGRLPRGAYVGGSWPGAGRSTRRRAVLASPAVPLALRDASH